jgi:2-keto-4-pentenoate hydratase/2-oxohepta-3-ene-1,7-dioic acid hydratase in catechol pathway
MTHWIRFAENGTPGFGTLDGKKISVHAGDMFDRPAPTGRTVRLDTVEVLTPTTPSKMIALAHNFHALATKLKVEIPAEPLYFLKASTSFLSQGQTISTPQRYEGKIIYEGELGIVIGKTCRVVPEAAAPDYIFGYTCINDVTAVDILNRNPGFLQWTRSKSFDTFGVFGPVIATGLDPMSLTVRTVLNGEERQNYPVADIVFPPAALVSLISNDMTLLPGDVIACGTSIGVGSMKPGSTVSIVIDGIGALTNRFE